MVVWRGVQSGCGVFFSNQYNSFRSGGWCHYSDAGGWCLVVGDLFQTFPH